MATAPALYRNAAVQDARGLRVPRHDQRGADDADRQARRCRPTTTPSWSSGSRRTRARSTSPTPAWARPRTCAACCSRARSRSTCRPCPTRAPAPAMTDLLGGQVDLMCDQTTNTTGQIEAGKVKAYAVTSSQAADDAGAEEPADARRGRPEGLQRHHLARPVRAQGHAEGGRPTSSTPRCARR